MLGEVWFIVYAFYRTRTEATLFNCAPEYPRIRATPNTLGAPAWVKSARYAESKKWYHWLMVLCSAWPADTQLIAAVVDCTLPGIPVIEPAGHALERLRGRVRRGKII